MAVTQACKRRGKASKYNLDTSERCFTLFKGSIKSPDTAYLWTNNLNTYADYCKVRKYSDLLKFSPEKVQNKLVDYVQYKQTKIRPQSVGVQLTALRHFYWINGFKGIEWDRVRAFVGETVKAVQDVPYTHEQIRELVKHAKHSLRICILSEAQSGPRIGAIATIKKGDLLKTNHGFYRVVVHPGTKAEYVTYFHPETSKEIDDYLAGTLRRNANR